MKEKLYVQFGSGNKAVSGWINYDSSPTLFVQKIPIIGKILRHKLNCIFDQEILFGDIVRGLPIEIETVDGLFCSHVLEHLSLEDFHTALGNCYKYLKPGGIFRIIVPDISFYINEYLSEKQSKNGGLAANNFMVGTSLGVKKSRASFVVRIFEAFGNSGHKWMWDYDSLFNELTKFGFIEICRFKMGDCDDKMFLLPEMDYQFGDMQNPYGLAIQCKKPLI